MEYSDFYHGYPPNNYIIVSNSLVSKALGRRVIIEMGTISRSSRYYDFNFGLTPLTNRITLGVDLRYMRDTLQG